MFASTLSSHAHRILLIIAAACALLVAAAGPALAQGRRAALVIGNGAYAERRLPNPANDAIDMAAALKDAGFDVILRTDLDLGGMESALADFRSLLKGADTALFYYAGHGAQVDGENYLVPVREQIENEMQARQRGVAVSDVIYRIKETGVPTALVFLDACRDNPFPGSSRSATRGLTVEPISVDIETLIAYATEPGGVSADGTGRNGVFTAALLANMKRPGLGISEMMIKVRADVMAQTGGKQKPRTDVGLSRPFYFYDPAASAARAQDELKRNQEDLAEIERQVADREAAIAATKDAAKRQDLEVQRQREKALAAAKKLEAENLAAVVERQQKAAALAQQAALQRQSADLASREQQKALNELAASRRAELDTLAQAGASDDPDILIETVEKLEAALKEIDAKYTAALQKGRDAANATWDKQLAVLASEAPDKTETDEEFSARITAERNDLEAQRQADLSQIKSTADVQRESQTAGMRRHLEETLSTLQAKTWTIRGSAVSVKVGTFDRNARRWPFTVESRDRAVPMAPVDLVAELANAPDPKQAIRDLDAAVAANAIAAEIDWGLAREASDGRYAVILRGVRLVNLTSNQVVVELEGAQRIAEFAHDGRKSATTTIATIVVGTGMFDGPATITITGGGYGAPLVMNAPCTRRLYPGTYEVKAVWQDAKQRSVTVTLGDGETRRLSLTKPFTTETRNFYRCTISLGSGESGTGGELGAGFKWIGELSGYTHLLNPLFAQASLGAMMPMDDTSSDSDIVMDYEASAAVGAWLLGSPETRPAQNTFGLGAATGQGGLGLGVGAGVGVNENGAFGEVVGDLVITFSEAMSLETELQAIVPFSSSQPWELRIEIPLLGGGSRDGEPEEH